MKPEEIKDAKVPYLLFSYNFNTLKNLFWACSEITNELLNCKLQNNYFETYFNEIKAKTIILEKNYVDKDFLEDYANYYARCFNPYKRFCSRLHFFNIEFDDNYFRSLLTKMIFNFEGETKRLQDSYLGFIVIKNLPSTIIGRTCLKTYKIEETGRFFPVTRINKTSLFGISLEVKSLAFQEQDNVVAACATSALWSMFHGTGELFQHPITSPSEITKLATDNFPLRTRVFPNKSLELEMIAKAIKDVGLEPLFINTDNIVITKAAIYAYLKSEIPLMLAFGLLNIENEVFLNTGHAVAVGGFHLNEESDFIGYKPKNSQFPNSLFVKASKIDKIYVHDDQVGPFARMEFKHDINNRINGEYNWKLSTSWGMQNKKENYVAQPFALLVPTYHKIRIPYQVILDQLYHFDSWIELWKSNSEGSILKYLPTKIEWDIHLITVDKFKESIINNPLLSAEYKYKICTKNYPKYMWYVGGYLDEKIIIEILFDATDIEQNEFVEDVIEYDKDIYRVLAEISYKTYEGIKPLPVHNCIISYLSGKNYNKFKTLETSTH